MKRTIYYIPALLALILYLILGITCGFNAIHTLAWVCIFILFISGFLMSNKLWYGFIFGILVGFLLIYMSMIDTGQILNIERPSGFILCAYYGICGVLSYKKK